MDTRQIIETSFNNEVESLFKEKTDIKNFILNHERKELCINNLLGEVKKSELLNASIMTRKNIEFLGKEYAKTFSKAALNLAEQESVSELERQRRVREAEIKEDVANFFNSEDHSQSLE